MKDLGTKLIINESIGETRILHFEYTRHYFL